MHSTHVPAASVAPDPLPETMAHFVDGSEARQSGQRWPGFQAYAPFGYLKNISTGHSATDGTYVTNSSTAISTAMK
jgi:hypothetical protein